MNEMMLDNAYPLKNGITWYLDNMGNERDEDLLCRVYLECYFNHYYQGNKKGGFEAYYAGKEKEFKEDVRACMILNNLMWGVWAILMIKEGEYEKEGLFNYDFLEARVEMLQKVR